MKNDKSLIKLLQNKINKDIPLTKHMGVHVIEYKKYSLVLSAPLKNNINHRQTAFGGSITSLATLCCWGLLYLELNQLKLQSRIVIKSGTTEYLKSVTENFYANCSIPEGDKFDNFIKTITRKAIARINLTSEIICKNEVVARFDGSFVAIKSSHRKL